jgi:hypothetical protein
VPSFNSLIRATQQRLFELAYAKPEQNKGGKFDEQTY